MYPETRAVHTLLGLQEISRKSSLTKMSAYAAHDVDSLSY
jgi:hypothetical protein